MEKDSPLKQINSSGFPFQMRVEQEIKDSYQTHKWFSIGLEQHWKNVDWGTEGFIDIVLEKPNSYPLTDYMVIECKRISGGKWIFLKLKSQENKINDSIFSYCQSNDKPQLKWNKKNFKPDSFVSSFCAVPGQNNKDTPMLERVSEKLLDSLESLATKQRGILTSSAEPFHFKSRFIPVIITNAELVVCEFESSDIDLLDGVLKNKNRNFKPVSFLRFQKSFTTRYTTENIPMNLKEANKEDERTIWIVHAPSISDFLKQWEET